MAHNVGSHSYPTQLSMILQLLIKTLSRKIKSWFALKLSDVLFVPLINVKMATNVCIIPFMILLINANNYEQDQFYTQLS